PGLRAQPTREALTLRRAHSLQRPALRARRKLTAVQVFPAVEPDVVEGESRNVDFGIGDTGEYAADVVVVDVGDHQQFEAALILGKGVKALCDQAARLFCTHVDHELVGGSPPHPDRVALTGGKELNLETHLSSRPGSSTL